MKIIKTLFILILAFAIKTNHLNNPLNQELISMINGPAAQSNLYQVYKLPYFRGNN